VLEEARIGGVGIALFREDRPVDDVTPDRAAAAEG
jgi:hypothetical protein